MVGDNHTAARIVDVAQDMVQRRGYHAFSYGDIAKRIGIKTASIHYYFPSKGDLGEAVLRRVRGEFCSALVRIDAATPDALEKLQHFAAIFLDTLGAGDRLCPCCMLATDQDTVPEGVKEQVRGFFADGEAWLVGVLEAGRRDGRLQLLDDPQTIAQTLLSALEGVMVTARAFGQRERLIAATRFLLRGLAGGGDKTFPADDV